MLMWQFSFKKTCIPWLTNSSPPGGGHVRVQRGQWGHMFFALNVGTESPGVHADYLNFHCISRLPQWWLDVSSSTEHCKPIGLFLMGMATSSLYVVAAMLKGRLGFKCTYACPLVLSSSILKHRCTWALCVPQIFSSPSDLLRAGFSRHDHNGECESAQSRWT